MCVCLYTRVYNCVCVYVGVNWSCHGCLQPVKLAYKVQTQLKLFFERHHRKNWLASFRNSPETYTELTRAFTTSPPPPPPKNPPPRNPSFLAFLFRFSFRLLPFLRFFFLFVLGEWGRGLLFFYYSFSFLLFFSVSFFVSFFRFFLFFFIFLVSFSLYYFFSVF